MPPKVNWKALTFNRRGNRGSDPAVPGIPSSRRKKKHIIVDSLKMSLQFLFESSDACPPLKSAIGAMQHILSVVESIKGNKAEAIRIRKRIEQLIELLSDEIPDATKISPKLLISVMRLDDDLELVLKDLAPHENKTMLSRLVDKKKDLHRLQSAREQIETLIGAFSLRNEIQIRVSTDLIPELCAKVDSLHYVVDRQSQITSGNESDDLKKPSAVMIGILFI